MTPFLLGYKYHPIRIALVCGIFSATSFANPDVPILPEPPYTQDLPEHTEWGGKGLPEISGTASDDAPAISAISEITFADETMVMSGFALKNATLTIWAEGGLQHVNPLFAFEDRLAAVVPSGTAKSTMLVWPKHDGKYGEAIRVNGATSWWCWPKVVTSNKENQPLFILGKSLQLESAKPIVYVSGAGFSDYVPVTNANPYKLEVSLPKLAAGSYRLWSHNGTGGRYGWSTPISFNVLASNTSSEHRSVNVTDFGAIPNDGKDDFSAINAAIQALAADGGGDVHFPEGEFNLSKTLVIVSENIRLIGTGMGEWSKSENQLSGTFTLLTSSSEKSSIGSIIDIRSKGTALENLSIMNGHDGQDQRAVGIFSSDVNLQGLRIVMLDHRDWGFKNPGPWSSGAEPRGKGPYATGIIDSGALFIDTEGPANILFSNSEVHATGPGLQVGRFTGWDSSVSQPASESIWIQNVDFRGYYAGEPDGKINPGASGRATGIVVYSGRQIGVDHCTFEGADREKRKIMGRTVLVFNTSARNLYFGENTSMHVGPHPSAVGIDPNQGEQYLIHYRYPHGGLFDVVTAAASTLTITTENIQPFPKKRDPSTKWDLRSPHFHFDTRGGQVLPEVNSGGNWILFVSHGKGVGQFREIQNFAQKGDAYTFTLDKPWRVQPDSTSRVNLMPAYRQIAIYKNHVDTGKLIESLKTHGVTFWFDSFDNVVEANTFKNLTSGIIFNSRFRGPTGWNSTRENIVENIAGEPGDTSEIAAGYVDHFRVVVQWPNPEDRVWYQVGNVSRRNVIRKAQVGMYLHTRYTGLVRTKKPPTQPHPNGGIVMSVLELNNLENVDQGIVLSLPVNSSVIRDNTIRLSEGSSVPIIQYQDGEEGVLHSIVSDNITP